MAEPTIVETARFMQRLLTAGTVRRLDLLHEALCTAYRVGAADAMREARGETPAETCLEG